MGGIAALAIVQLVRCRRRHTAAAKRPVFDRRGDVAIVGGGGGGGRGAVARHWGGRSRCRRHQRVLRGAAIGSADGSGRHYGSRAERRRARRPTPFIARHRSRSAFGTVVFCFCCMQSLSVVIVPCGRNARMGGFNLKLFEINLMIPAKASPQLWFSWSVRCTFGIGCLSS